MTESMRRRRTRLIGRIVSNSAEACYDSRNGWAVGYYQHVWFYVSSAGVVAWSYGAEIVPTLGDGTNERALTRASTGFLEQLAKVIEWRPCLPFSPLERLAQSLEDEQT